MGMEAKPTLWSYKKKGALVSKLSCFMYYCTLSAAITAQFRLKFLVPRKPKVLCKILAEKVALKITRQL